MKKVLAAIFCALLWTSAFGAEGWLACKRVVDGDTIVVEGIGKVRLLGVDTPELAHDGRRAERGAEEARKFTTGMVLGKKVRLEYDVDRLDKFGRTLAYVYTEKGEMLNRELLRKCLAEPMYHFPYAKKGEFIKMHKDFCVRR